jgi:hypothetical protein
MAGYPLFCGMIYMVFVKSRLRMNNRMMAVTITVCRKQLLNMLGYLE